MKFSERYRPQSLREVAGQPPVRVLMKFMESPYSTCFCLEGPPGCGKSLSAQCLANELGCVDKFSGRHTVVASEFGIDAARELFERSLRLKPLMGNGWNVVILEELELLSGQCQTYLKHRLENLPDNCVVIATSNGAGKLQAALLERFTILVYSGGEVLSLAYQDKLRSIWAQESDHAPLPSGWDDWGWVGERFSVRVALDQMQRALLSRATQPALRAVS